MESPINAVRRVLRMSLCWGLRVRSVRQFFGKDLIMKRVVLILIFGFMFGAVVFAQPPAPMDFQPLVNFDDVFEDIRKFFTDILKEYYAMFLTIFVVWFGLGCAKAYLDGRWEKIKAEVKRQDRVANQAVRSEERNEAARLVRQREMERTGYVAAFEAEYRSRALQDIVLREHESLVMIDSKRYVREMTSEGDIIGHKTIDQWRADIDKSEDEPLAFDNDDHGRTYVNGVAVDKDDEGPGYWWFKDSHLRSLENNDDEYEESTFEDRVNDWVNSNSSFETSVSRRSRRERFDSGFDDESEYANSRGEFRGGY